MKKTLVAAVVLTLLIASSLLSLQAAAPAAMLFDDFSYTDKQQMKQNGWIIRTEAGWPGVPGATWLDQNVCDSQGSAIALTTGSCA